MVGFVKKKNFMYFLYLFRYINNINFFEIRFVKYYLKLCYIGCNNKLYKVIMIF